MKNLKIYPPLLVETGNRFGNMNRWHFNTNQGDFEKRSEMFLENRKKAARFFGFDPYKVYVPTQGMGVTYAIVDDDIINKKEDGWDVEIPADILMVRKETPQVLVGYPVADCAVLILSDLKKGVTATAHCSGKMTDEMLPMKTLHSLKEVCNSQDEDIFLYLSACIGKDWTYTTFPSWIKNLSLWEESHALQVENGLYKIDLRKAILSQLKDVNFHHYLINLCDTNHHDAFYSHSQASLGNTKKYGRHFAGAFYPKEQ